MDPADRQQTPFQRYLEALGDVAAAELLQARVRTVKSWRLGDRRPRPEEARSIVARTPVTFDDIYGATAEERAKALEEAGALVRAQAANEVHGQGAA